MTKIAAISSKRFFSYTSRRCSPWIGRQDMHGVLTLHNVPAITVTGPILEKSSPEPLKRSLATLPAFVALQILVYSTQSV